MSPRRQSVRTLGSAESAADLPAPTSPGVGHHLLPRRRFLLARQRQIDPALRRDRRQARRRSKKPSGRSPSTCPAASMPARTTMSAISACSASRRRARIGIRCLLGGRTDNAGTLGGADRQRGARGRSAGYHRSVASPRHLACAPMAKSLHRKLSSALASTPFKHALGGASRRMSLVDELDAEGAAGPRRSAETPHADAGQARQRRQRRCAQEDRAGDQATGWSVRYRVGRGHISFDAGMAGEAPEQGGAILLQPADDVRALRGQLERAALIAVDFHRIGDGRGYTHRLSAAQAARLSRPAAGVGRGDRRSSLRHGARRLRFVRAARRSRPASQPSPRSNLLACRTRARRWLAAPLNAPKRQRSTRACVCSSVR